MTDGANLICRTEEGAESTEYWAPGPSLPKQVMSRVQVMPVHGQDETIYISNSGNSQVVIMDGAEALTLEQQTEMMKANRGEWVLSIYSSNKLI